jgi:hypothetical protein
MTSVTMLPSEVVVGGRDKRVKNMSSALGETKEAQIIKKFPVRNYFTKVQKWVVLKGR